MTDATLPVTGYLDRLSARPGEALLGHVSLRTAGDYRVRLQRMICADPNPDGPGLRTVDHADLLDLTLPGTNQPVPLGSYARIEAAPHRPAHAPATWTALICPGVTKRDQVVLSETAASATVSLGIGPAGAFARLTFPGGEAGIALNAPLCPRAWYRVWLAADPSSGRLLLGVNDKTAEGHATGLLLPDAGCVLIAAENPAWPRLHFTGKIEDPAILSGFVADWPDALSTLAAPPAPLLAGWDFARDIGGLAVTDTGPSACHGTVVNMPNRAMVGARWSGREACWRHAPEDYAAIHFHADDLADCGWEPGFAFTVPDGLRSGVYMFHLTCADGEDWLPFYVLPARDAVTAPIVFLASTFTYLAYANHARGTTDDAYRRRVADWDAYKHSPDDYPVYSRSTYNKHPDGSGISLSSRLRPVLTMRPGYLTFDDAQGSGLRHFPADSHLLAWLEDKGLAYDVVTDEDLDNEGAALLAPYRLVLTGTHPEYHTPRMLDALEAYKAQAGRLAYLGGNGFYWRIARDPALPHVIEVRRAEGGIRAWAAEPGEYYHQLDGALGGMWRRSRRPPQMLVGVGFTGQAAFESSYYRRTEASQEPAFAWMFDGVEGDVIGDYGLSGGGAAGFELDRADIALGTPRNAVILARSENPPPSMTLVLEELLSHPRSVNGEPPADLMRAEIVWFDTPSGGAVFAVGSITFCGSLWRDGGFQGPVSRLLENVVRMLGFADAV